MLFSEGIGADSYLTYFSLLIVLIVNYYCSLYKSPNEAIAITKIFQHIVKLIIIKINIKHGICYSITYHSGTIDAGVDIGLAWI